jgi:hypothetical protein
MHTKIFTLFLKTLLESKRKKLKESQQISAFPVGANWWYSYTQAQ